jgi:hypothetical protein
LHLLLNERIDRLGEEERHPVALGAPERLVAETVWLAFETILLTTLRAEGVIERLAW